MKLFIKSFIYEMFKNTIDNISIDIMRIDKLSYEKQIKKERKEEAANLSKSVKMYDSLEIEHEKIKECKSKIKEELRKTKEENKALRNDREQRKSW